MYNVRKQEESIPHDAFHTFQANSCAGLCSKKLIFLIRKELVLLQNNPSSLLSAKIPSIVLSTPIYYNLNLSFCDLWPTLTLEIPTICLLVLYMGKYKRFHKRRNLCGPCPAGNIRNPCANLLSNSFVFYWLKYLYSHFMHCQLCLHVCYLFCGRLTHVS